MHYYLEITRGFELGKRFPLPEGATSIGRSSQNSLAFDPSQKNVSSHHAIIYKSGDRIAYQDLDSTNGSFVNEQQVTEKALVVGDEIGLGKNGPRLKLYESETEISAPSPGVSFAKTTTTPRDGSYGIEDSTEKIGMHSVQSTAMEPNALRAQKEAHIFASNQFDESEPLSNTMHMEKKLFSKEIDAKDMGKLLKNGRMVEKIIERGNISHTQSTMLRTTLHASRNNNRQWMIILGIVCVVSLAAISFFAIRAYQYHAILSKGLTLKDALNKQERTIAKAQNDPKVSDSRLKDLIAQLEATKSQLAEVKSRVNEKDQVKFYSDPIEEAIDKILRGFGDNNYSIPPQMVERVKFHINFYAYQNAGMMSRYLIRKEEYFPTIIRVFAEKKLPKELAFISMLESGFNPKALSPVGARGLWQFMPATGQRYGLTVNDIVDERLDPEKATYAAAEYFKDLVAIFGGQSSVMLAMAAYNAGEGRIMGVLRKIDDPMRNRDFWYIYRMGYLADETREYIPRVIALMIISDKPENFKLRKGIPATVNTAALENENDFIKLDIPAGK